MPINIVIVEDDAFTRLTLESAIREMGYSISLATGSASEATQFMGENQVDLMILDLYLGRGPTGLDVSKAYRRLAPTGGIVFLTSYSDPRLLDPSAGALPEGSVYITKSQIGDIDELRSGIEKALAQQGSPDASVAGQALANLTPGQLEILKLVAEGLSNAEIAKKIYITEKSVETAISRIAKALNLSADVARNQRVHIAKVYFRAIGLNVAN